MSDDQRQVLREEGESMLCIDCGRELNAAIIAAFQGLFEEAAVGDQWDGPSGPSYRCTDCVEALEEEARPDSLTP